MYVLAFLSSFNLVPVSSNLFVTQIYNACYYMCKYMRVTGWALLNSFYYILYLFHNNYESSYTSYTTYTNHCCLSGCGLCVEGNLSTEETVLSTCWPHVCPSHMQMLGIKLLLIVSSPCYTWYIFFIFVSFANLPIFAN